MESDEESEPACDWTQLDSMKSFEWEESKSISNLLQSSFGHFDSSTKLVDNTPSVRDNFIEQLAPKASAPVSLLVESLLQQLCSLIEPNRTNADHLYKTICTQLHHMNLIDDTYKMSEFDVMRSQYQRALYQLTTVARGQKEIPLNLQSVWPLSDSACMQWSRYHRDFDEIKFVAGGGFGRVFRARNKLDGIEYAVKKVTIKYRTVKRILSHIAEVKTFASLNHYNIVPYKAAWLEPLFDDPSMDHSRLTDANHRRKRHTIRKRYGRTSSKITSLSKGHELAIFDVDSKMSTATNIEEEESNSETDTSESDDENATNKEIQNDADESSDFIQFKHTQDDVVDGANVSSMNSTQDKRLCKPMENHSNNNYEIQFQQSQFDGTQPHLKLKWATLYIQMSFRPLTLRMWLDERNKHADFNAFYQKFIEKSVQQTDRVVSDDEDDALNQNGAAGPVAKYTDRNIHRSIAPSLSNSSLEKNVSKVWDSLEVTLNIFRQTLSGLQYIQMQNIVHHDIKPSNIFVGCEKNGELYVQLGDFGLACPLQARHSKDSIIGTLTYAAPEQLKGFCDPKSDVFSLGIILLELLIPFNTDMERLKTFEAARKGVFPPNIPPKYLSLLKILLEKHHQRPDANGTFELLSKLELSNENKGSTQEHSSQHSHDLQNQLSQVTDELNQLKMQMATPQRSDVSEKSDTTNGSCQSIHVSCNESRSSTSNSISISVKENGSIERLDGNHDKDQQIDILNRENCELKIQIQQLRDELSMMKRNG